MTEPITCPRCRRAFGGDQAYRRGHRRYHGDGKGKRERCRPVRELERSWALWRDEDGVWHVRGPATPGQMRLPVLPRGRPMSPVARAWLINSAGQSYRVWPRPRRHPKVEPLEVAA